MATDIKTKVEIYAYQLLKNIKIKLSIDDKNKYSNKLVSSIYQYLIFKIFLSNINDFNKEIGNNIKNNIAILKNFKNVLSWLFFTENEKDEILKAYKYLKENIDIYKNKVHEIHSSFKNLKIDSALSWDYFQEHSIDFNNVLEELFPDLFDNSSLTNGLPEELAREIENQEFFPEGLKCTLRNYQILGSSTFFIKREYF